VRTAGAGEAAVSKEIELAGGLPGMTTTWLLSTWIGGDSLDSACLWQPAEKSGSAATNDRIKNGRALPNSRTLARPFEHHSMRERFGTQTSMVEFGF
jgi:hypothetical protein